MAITYLLQSFGAVLSPMNLAVLLISTFTGLVMGMLPGLSATMAVALLTGLTYSLSPTSAIISLIGVYVGAISGGCQAAILLNIPGTPASAATALDGFPLAKQGKGGLAVFLATTASCIGTLISVICVLAFTPLLTKLSLQFGSWEFFLLSLFGVVICGNLTSKGNAVKGWISGIIGLLVAQVGLDQVDAFPRFAFGNVNVMAGLALIPIMIGLFGFPEIIKAFKKTEEHVLKISKFKVSEGFTYIRQNTVALIRSSLIGVCVGIIPGVGEDVGGWLSYWATKSSSKDPEKFGTGEMSGVISAEAGNNSCIGGAIIPILSLAVPGSAPAAVLLAAFMMHGYRPGPLLMNESPEFLYMVCVDLFMAAVAMWMIAQLVAKFSVKILGVKKEILMPIIYVLCIVGSYVINHLMFDVKVMFFFGIVGFFLSMMEFPAAPFLLGVILGSMTDSNLRRALTISEGSFMPMFQRPICLVFLVAILALILSQFGVFEKLKRKKV
ncbi:MAG: tripartite tricarboxylate transporter permease [Lachnospiraceae bacterium]|nr:tripartite tricarboxylate transporter permease [Lachnospiraceae bacterium]